MTMRFVLNERVYRVDSLDQVRSVLNLDEEIEDSILSVLYYFTHRAVIEDIDRLVRLAAQTTLQTAEQYGPAIAEETKAFRSFLTAVEQQYPKAPALAEKLIADAKAGKISLDGKGIVLIVE